MNKDEIGVAAVDRALAVLGAFREGDTSLSLHELATRTGLYKSTILRLLASLARRECIVRLDDGSYQPGPMLLHWGSLYLGAVKVETHILPILQTLAREAGESATFYTRQQDARVCLARVDSAHSVRDHVKVGDILPLDRGAGGRVLLGFDTPAKVRRAGERKSMVMVTFRERDAEGAGMAAPVFGPGETLRGAISLSGSAVRFHQAALPRLTRLLLSAAAEMTGRLGGNPAALLAAVG
ncbi:MAG: helix-turn-helix domain-containing protein [Burkholderiaceae bacterium]|nr:helix-turn-helix domain-containing protein [Burkholderiaceae bacterium]